MATEISPTDPFKSTLNSAYVDTDESVLVSKNASQHIVVTDTEKITVSTAPHRSFADLETALEAIDTKLYEAIDLNQVAILSAELAKEILRKKAWSSDYQQVAEMLEHSNSNCIENCELIKEARGRLDAIVRSITKAEYL
jgi:hypothetical protein